MGSTISFTKAVTSLEAAWPITNAIASPIIPNVLRKSKNSCAKVLLTSGEDGGYDDGWYVIITQS